MDKEAEKPLRQLHDDLTAVVVDASDEILGSGDERAIVETEEHVGRAVVDAGYAAYMPAACGIDQVEPGKVGPCVAVAFVAVGLAAKEVDVTIGKLACPLHGVDVLKLDEGGGIGAEAVFLHKERYEDAVDHQDETIGIDTVEDVVVDLHGYLAMHAVGLAQPSNLVYFVLSDHVMRVMWAPSALSLFSMFS